MGMQSSAMINSGLLTDQAPCRDEDRGFQLYHSDPSGNYGGWKATAIGQNHQAAQNIMKQDYKEDMDLQAAMQLVIKVCSPASIMHEPCLLSCTQSLGCHRVKCRLMQGSALNPRIAAVGAYCPGSRRDPGTGARMWLHVTGSQQNDGQHHPVTGKGGAGHHQPCARHPAGMPRLIFLNHAEWSHDIPSRAWRSKSDREGADLMMAVLHA